MPKPTLSPEPQPIRLRTNAIFDGRYFPAGTPIPVKTIDELTPNLQAVVCSAGELEEEPPESIGAQHTANFQLNTPYSVADDGRLGRAQRRRVERQVAELQADAEEDEWLEEQVVAAGELPQEIAEDLADTHRKHIEFERAQLAADARRVDAAEQVAIALTAPLKMFVRRGSRHYLPVDKARKLKASEPVYIKNPESGRFEHIGDCDSDGQLPDPPAIT
jgi:hypothetical protein